MPQDDQFRMILEKMTEIGERTARIETRVESVERAVEYIKEEDAVQNNLLAEHIAGVRTNRKRLELEKQERLQSFEQLGRRVDSLEAVPKFLTSLKKVMLYLAAIAGSILTITKLMELW